MLLRRRYMGEKGGSIPYQRIEYLQSSGTQYIIVPMNVVAGDFLQVELNLYASYIGGQSLFGHSRQFTASRYNDSLLATNVGGSAQNGGLSFTLGEEINLLLSTEGKRGANGEYAVLQRPIKTAFSSVGIFRSIGSTGGEAFLLYSCKWTHNDTLYDLVPVRIGQVGYLYDTVSGELFGNAGTGDFILGSDIN